MKTKFTFTEDQTAELKKFMKMLHGQNWGMWPAPATWPKFSDTIGYCVNQYGTDTGQTFEVIKFDETVIIDGEQDRRFKFGGGKKYNPICTSLRY